MRTVEQTANSLPQPVVPELPAPAYTGCGGPGLGLAVESMKRHMTDEGWQLFAGLECAGYQLAGYGLSLAVTDVAELLKLAVGTVVLQDKREWDLCHGDFREPKAKFSNVAALRNRTDVFKLTVLKDAHQRPRYHWDSADEMGCHAWIVYYHPAIVKRVAPYVRREHTVRVYHTIDSRHLRPYTADKRNGCLLSGAVNATVYPLRKRLMDSAHRIHSCALLPHPGYHRRGCATPYFLRSLQRFKVAICTSSVYGYALRKIVEATAAGCCVVSDLPTDEVLPHIDSNVYRVSTAASVAEVSKLVEELCKSYDAQKQCQLAQAAKAYYDFWPAGLRLAADIEELRKCYATRR